MICITYWMNAIKSPICIAPLSIRIPPNQMTPTTVTFMTSINTGIKNAMIWFTLIETSVNASFAFVKRTCSSASRLNARMTRMPVKFSRRTRFKRSSRCCTVVKSGIAFQKISKMDTTSTGIAATMTSESLASFEIAIIKPPTNMIGALTTIRNIMIITCCTCVMSFVVRVMSDAVPTRSNSSSEKRSTWLNTRRRKSRPNPIAAFEE